MQREQDYLVFQPGGQQSEDTQRSYRLAGGPSFGVSSTGGQMRPAQNFMAAQQSSPDRARQTFRTRERQIREGRPIDFTVSQAEPTRQLIEADIRSQGNKISRDLAETAPKVEEFLPDYQKALKGDQAAIGRTGERLQGDFDPREVPQIRTSEGQAMLDFLRAPSQEAFQTELARQRGGTFGINALDAARLGVSGVGSQAFAKATKDIGQVYNLIPQITKSIQAKELQRERDYETALAKLRGAVSTDEAAMRNDANREIQAYRDRNINADLDTLLSEVKALNPDLVQYLGMDYAGLSPFIDRELTFAETLSPEEQSRYNVLAELLGTTPVQRLERESPMNRDAIIAALLAEAQNERQAALIAQKQESERRARQAAGARQQAEDDRRERDLNRSTNITGGGQPVSRDTGVVDVTNW